MKPVFEFMDPDRSFKLYALKLRKILQFLLGWSGVKKVVMTLGTPAEELGLSSMVAFPKLWSSLPNHYLETQQRGRLWERHCSPGISLVVCFLEPTQGNASYNQQLYMNTWILLVFGRCSRLKSYVLWNTSWKQRTIQAGYTNRQTLSRNHTRESKQFTHTSAYHLRSRLFP